MKALRKVRLMSEELVRLQEEALEEHRRGETLPFDFDSDGNLIDEDAIKTKVAKDFFDRKIRKEYYKTVATIVGCVLFVCIVAAACSYVLIENGKWWW